MKEDPTPTPAAPGDKTCALIAWLDLETTGTDAQVDHILEAALLITDASGQPVHTGIIPQLNDRDVHMYAYVAPTKEALARIQVDAWIRETHKRSGLLKELVMAGTISIKELERQIIYAIRQFDVPTSRIFLGGRNPEFERNFLRAHMPNALKYISYRNVDITSCEALAMKTPYYVEHTAENSPHRAVPDVLREVERYRHIKAGLLR